LHISNMALSNDIDNIDLDAPLPPRIYDIDVLSRFFDEDDIAELAADPATEGAQPKHKQKVFSRPESTKAMKTTARSASAISPAQTLALPQLPGVPEFTYRRVSTLQISNMALSNDIDIITEDSYAGP